MLNFYASLTIYHVASVLLVDNYKELIFEGCTKYKEAIKNEEYLEKLGYKSREFPILSILDDIALENNHLASFIGSLKKEFSY